jgi:ABC-type molybdate transport system ATPase subunit
MYKFMQFIHSIGESVQLQLVYVVNKIENIINLLKNIVYFEQGCYNVTVIKRD